MREIANNQVGGGEARRFGSADYVKITILGFGLTALWSSLHIIILPLRLLDFVPEAVKNTYLDLLVLTGLILAMVVQPIAGAMSDCSRFTWGCRRPYILVGIILLLLFLPGVGFLGSYVAIFLLYCLMQISSNTVQGPYQAFIPDLVPEGKRGLASGVRSLFNIVGGVALVRLVAVLMDRYWVGGGSTWLWLSLSIPGSLLLGTMLVTVLMVREYPRSSNPRPPLLSTLSQIFRVDVKVRGDFILFLVACFLIFTALNTLMAHALYYLMDVVGGASPARLTADLTIVMGISMLAVVYPAGRLSDRLGRRPIVVFAGLFGALGTVLLFFSQSYREIMLSGGLLGISGGAWLSSQWALATDLVTKGEEARYLGLVNLSIAGAGAAARLIGPVIDFFNNCSAGLGYQVMLLVAFIYFVVGSTLLLKMRIRTLLAQV